MQDAVAELVAAEMKKIIRKELEPSAPPPAVPQQGAPLDELAALQARGDDRRCISGSLAFLWRG